MSSVKINELNRGMKFSSGSGMDEEIIYLKLLCAQTVKIRYEKWEHIQKKSCQKCPNLQKIWIPKELTTIHADTLENAPYYGCNENLQIFTNVASADEIPEGWEEFWNYYAEGKTLNVRYGANISQYDAYKITPVDRF
ncbi:hypothetical protein IJX73_02985 [bacterium]|nr:hypothetical protein [bacterium]